MRYSKVIASFAFAALFGTGVGESSDPALSAAELPAEVVNECATLTVSDGNAGCQNQSFEIRWSSRTPRGHLFLVERSSCESADCRAWLIEKDPQGTRALLAIRGEFRLTRDGGTYPAVEVRAEVKTNYTRYSRYTWTNEGRYARTETRVAHRIDDFECGERECEAAAQEALKRNDADRAVKIWQQVHNVDWI